MRSASRPRRPTTAPSRSRATTASTGAGRCRRPSWDAPAPKPRSGCTSPTATPPTCGCGSTTARCAPVYGRSTTSLPHSISTAAGSARPALCCPPTCRWATTACTCAAATGESSAALIVTPAWLGLPERLGDRRAWGLATQLYSVRSQRSWGVGDLTDLTDLAVWSASRHGAGYVLVNPLHAAAPTKPMEPSPYLPTSRRFVNPLYLRVEAIPEFADLPKRGRVRRLRDERHARRAASSTRSTATPHGRPSGAALKLVHRVQRSAGRELAYAAFRVREGAALDDFATWCALAEKLRRRLASSGPSRCGTRRRRVWPISSTRTAPQSISTAGCSGNSTSNSPLRSPRRSAPACRWASCTTSRSACIPTAPTPGRCRTCWRSASPRARRPTSSTN